MSNHFFFGTEMNAIENHIAPLLRNLAANVLKWYKNRSTHMFVYIFLMPLVMAGCTRKYFLCITFGCPYNITRRDKAHSQEWLDWADEQADLMPFWVHRSFSWFVSSSSLFSFSINHHQHFFLPKAAGGARWLSGRVSDSGARARHFTPRKYWLITQEAVAPSRHDWKIVDWDVKPQQNQKPQITFIQKDWFVML